MLSSLTLIGMGPFGDDTKIRKMLADFHARLDREHRAFDGVTRRWTNPKYRPEKFRATLEYVFLIAQTDLWRDPKRLFDTCRDLIRQIDRLHEPLETTGIGKLPLVVASLLRSAGPGRFELRSEIPEVPAEPPSSESVSAFLDALEKAQDVALPPTEPTLLDALEVAQHAARMLVERAEVAALALPQRTFDNRRVYVIREIAMLVRAYTGGFRLGATAGFAGAILDEEITKEGVRNLMRRFTPRRPQ